MSRNMNQQNVNNHFNLIAKDYDKYKRRNLFNYYSTLKRKIKNLVPAGSSVLDYGCGTGEILNFLSPTPGVGYDPSLEMIKICKDKFKNLRFENDLKNIKQRFDYIILVDVIEHLSDPKKELQKIIKLMNNNTKLVISFVDTSWEWFPKILEAFHLKMPEGPHKRISYNEVVEIVEKLDFEIIKKSNWFSPVKILVLVHPKKD